MEPIEVGQVWRDKAGGYYVVTAVYPEKREAVLWSSTTGKWLTRDTPEGVLRGSCTCVRTMRFLPGDKIRHRDAGREREVVGYEFPAGDYKVKGILEEGGRGCLLGFGAKYIEDFYEKVVEMDYSEVEAKVLNSIQKESVMGKKNVHKEDSYQFTASCKEAVDMKRIERETLTDGTDVAIVYMDGHWGGLVSERLMYKLKENWRGPSNRRHTEVIQRALFTWQPIPVGGIEEFIKVVKELSVEPWYSGDTGKRNIKVLVKKIL